MTWLGQLIYLTALLGIPFYKSRKINRYLEDSMRSLKLFACAIIATGLLATTSFAAERPLSTATVSFGAWMTNPPLDRHPNSSPGPSGHHVVIPEEVTIKAGGTVNFIISNFHQVIVYDDGTQPESINTALTTPTTAPPPAVQLIDDPVNRIYRGPDPSVLPRDRVEVIHFDEPGRYLVICGVLPHFNAGMFGYVRVLPNEGKDPKKPHH